MEELINPRRKHHKDIESVPAGYANGTAVAPGTSLTPEARQEIIDNAAEAFGLFLDALRCDWRKDPNSMETPYRVAKAYVDDLWNGRYQAMPDITSFPADGYDGLITETNIPLVSMCSHHHQTIRGRVHVAYIPGPDGRVIGLSKLNRVVDYFGRRGAIQENLTMSIHKAVDKVCEGNIGVAVQIVAEHQCVVCRGVKHEGSKMVTTKLSGAFEQKPEVRQEFFKAIESANSMKS